MRYKIRALGLGGILDQTFTLIKEHLGILLAITGVLLIPYYLIGGLIQVAVMPNLPPNPTQEQVAAATLAAAKFTLPFQLIGVYIIAPITNAALVYSIATAYLGQPVSLGLAYGKAMGRLLPLLGTWFLVGMAIMGGMILCLIPGILAAFWFTLATQVVILEDRAGTGAMSRSRELMRGNIGQLFVLGLLLAIINGGLSISAELIPQPHAQAVVVAIVMGITTILYSTALVVFYFSCRCKLENFDLALLAESVGEKPPTEPMIGDPELQW